MFKDTDLTLSFKLSIEETVSRIFTKYIWFCWRFVIVGTFMAECCDCGGKMKEYC